MYWKIQKNEYNIYVSLNYTTMTIHDIWNGATFEEETWIITFSDGYTIQTEPVSEAAQEWAEEYMKILESAK